MIENQDLWVTIKQLRDELNVAVDRYEQAGENLAEAERDYQLTMTKKAFEWKDEGKTVTYISSFIKGEESVAEKRFKRDLCEAKRNALSEKVNAIKLQIKILDAQASREWSDRPTDY